MTSLLTHRGPDDESYYFDGSLGLGHRRLSIIDLSPLGRQPMSNEDGSVWVILNGEIYNFQELRPALEQRGHRFRSNTDTEVVVHLYEEHGPACLGYLRGMFALAIWDAKSRKLLLARDRVGKKPLVYSEHAGGISFASEVKALLADPEVDRAVDYDALGQYLICQHIPQPRTAFRSIRKLPPAHFLTVENNRVSLQPYWKLDYRNKTPLRGEELEEELRGQLSEAVRIRLVSDVPLGAFLSGGIDSSIVVALMSRHLNSPVKTFSIGFDDVRYSELPYARMVAARYATDHHEFVVKPSAVELLPKLVWHYDEPYADSSAVPTYYVAQLARRHVTVALTGDGGDESFAGYERYRAVLLSHYADWLPRPVVASLARAWSHLFGSAPPKSRARRLGRFLKMAALPAEMRYASLMASPEDGLYTSLCSPDFWARHVRDAVHPAVELVRASQAPTPLEQMMEADVRSYLPDDLLAKMDIASMACSLEARSPFLDHKVMELAASMPARLKLQGAEHKHIVKRAFRHLLPDPILNRPKMGFGVPLYRWFREDLREMANDLLLSPRAAGRGLFNPVLVRQMLAEHAAGKRPWQDHLWPLLILELWFRIFVDAPGPSTERVEEPLGSLRVLCYREEDKAPVRS